MLAETFATAGYSVTFPGHAPGELGVMIVSKVRIMVDPLGAVMDYLPARAADQRPAAPFTALRCEAPRWARTASPR